MSTSSVQSLRAVLAQHRPTVSRDGYPPQLQKATGELASHLRTEGWSDGRIARELGLSAATLRRWTQQSASAVPIFRPVAISGVAPAAPSPSQFTLVTPGGYRLEGLTLENAAVLLGRFK